MQALSGDQQIARVESKVDALEQRTNVLDKKLDGLEVNVDGLDQKVDGLETKMEKGLGEAHADFRTLFGLQMTTITTQILGFAETLLQHHL